MGYYDGDDDYSDGDAKTLIAILVIMVILVFLCTIPCQMQSNRISRELMTPIPTVEPTATPIIKNEYNITNYGTIIINN
jgi:hypothetical protein